MKCKSTFYEQKIKVLLSHNIFRQWNQWFMEMGDYWYYVDNLLITLEKI